MIVICEECGKKYRIDPDKIKGTQAAFNCRACRHRITVTKPETPDQKIGGPVSPAEEPDGKAPLEAPAKRKPGKPPATKKAPVAAAGKSRFGLTEKMISLMLMVTLLPLLVFWGLTFQQTNSRIRKDSEQLLVQRAVHLAGHVEEWVDKSIRVLKACADMSPVKSMDPSLQQPVFAAVERQYPWMDAVFAETPSGEPVAGTADHMLPNTSVAQYRKDILAGGDLAWQVYDTAAPAPPRLIIATPIRSGKQVIGILAGTMRVTALSKQIATRTKGRMGTPFLTDASGKVISHPNPRFVIEGKNLSGHPLIRMFKSGQRGLIGFADDKGAPAIGHVSETAFGWVLAVEAKEKEIFEILKKAQVFAYLFLAVIIVIVVFIAWLAGRAMTRPIKELTVAADRISVGELDVRIDVRRKDEIGDLAEAISRMQDSLRLSIERLRRRR